MKSNKNLTIETLRGMAIIFVVMGHVIGSPPKGGMTVDFPSIWRYLYMVLDYIQIPVFTAIAGWVYTYKPIGTKRASIIILDKFYRLIVPTVVVASIYYILQNLIPGTNNKSPLNEIWRVLIFPYSLYWYPQALFLIFTLIISIDTYIKQSYEQWKLLLIVSFILYCCQIVIIPYEIPNFFSFKAALNIFPYFVAGIGIQWYKDQLLLKQKYFYPLIIIGIVFIQIRWFYREFEFIEYYYILTHPIWIIATMFVVFNRSFSSRFLVYIGSYAYTIYLFHGFGTAGGRIVLGYFTITHQLIVFIFATVIALVMPIVVDKVLSRNRYLRLLFLGKRN